MAGEIGRRERIDLHRCLHVGGPIIADLCFCEAPKIQHGGRLRVDAQGRIVNAQAVDDGDDGNRNTSGDQSIFNGSRPKIVFDEGALSSIQNLRRFLPNWDSPRSQTVAAKIRLETKSLAVRHRQSYSNKAPTSSLRRHTTRQFFAVYAVVDRRSPNRSGMSRVARKTSLAPLADASMIVHGIKLSTPQLCAAVE
jgi:hypothetical protein